MFRWNTQEKAYFLLSSIYFYKELNSVDLTQNNSGCNLLEWQIPSAR